MFHFTDPYDLRFASQRAAKGRATLLLNKLKRQN